MDEGVGMEEAVGLGAPVVGVGELGRAGGGDAVTPADCVVVCVVEVVCAVDAGDVPADVGTPLELA